MSIIIAKSRINNMKTIVAAKPQMNTFRSASSCKVNEVVQ